MAQIEEKLQLEDTHVDILQKAQQGLHLSLSDLAQKTGISPERLRPVINGQQVDKEILVQLASALHLHESSLLDSAMNTWYPQPIEPFTGLATFTTWYGDMTVNAYLVWDPLTREAASFDTGSRCQPILEFQKAHQLQLKKIFITHTHPDHLADLALLRRKSPDATAYGPSVENPLDLAPLQHGDELSLGSLKIQVLGTHGHTPGGLSYYVQGLARPVVIVGDALFAGSMGRAPHAYQDALRNNRDYVMSLPPQTVICPGHGPLTTVEEERAHNPFFPEFKPGSFQLTE